MLSAVLGSSFSKTMLGIEFWKGFQVPKRVRLVIYGVFLNFPGAVLPRNLQCSGLLWHSCQPSQPTNQPSPAQPSQTSQSSLFLVFLHTKCFLGVRNGRFTREGWKWRLRWVSGGLCFTIQNASWLSETGLPCESGATSRGAGGRSRGKTRYF